eukprot:jgi/Mesen1/9590/ME000657S08875
MMGPQGEVSVSFDTSSAHVLTAPQHRRVPHGPPMQPLDPGLRAPYSNIPNSGPGSAGMAFMSFDLGNTGSYAPPPRSGIGGGSFGAGGYEDEPPLLEELGIDIPKIVRKMVSVLNPLRINADVHEDGDLSGPLLFCLLFGLCQLLGGKVHFGIILGWASLASLFLYLIFNLLVGAQAHGGSLDLYRCCSLIGYCLLPHIVFSSISLFMPHRSLLSLVLAGLTVLWSTRTCSSLLVTLVPQAEEQRSLVAYVCAVIFSMFALLVLF